MQVTIPLTSLVFEIPDEALPQVPTPTVAGAIVASHTIKLSPGQTTVSQVAEPTSLALTLTPSALGNRFRIRACGIAGHGDPAGGFVSFAMFRNGVSLVPPDETSHAVARPRGDTTETFNLEIEDAPVTIDPVTYDLRWKVSAGQGYLGRRAQDRNILVATTLTVEEMVPL